MVAKRLASPALLAAGMLIASLGAVAAPASTAAASAHVAAPAARPGHWSQVTTPTVADAIIHEIGLARGSNGVLHVLWLSGKGPYKIMDTPISASGTVGRAVTVASGWFLATDPDATVLPGRLAVLWNGDKNSTGKPQGTFEATRPLSGGSWSVSSTVTPNLVGAAFPGLALTAATGSDGKPWVAYNGTNSMVVGHLGHPEVQISPNRCCLYLAGLATDGRSGQTWISYGSLITARMGIFARPLTQSGRPAGPAVLLPGSRQRGNVFLPGQRIGVTARGHGRAGVFAAYGSGWPTFHKLEVIRLGSRTPRTLASFGSAEAMAGSTIAAEPSGRLWVTWFFGDGTRPGLFVRRSTTAATSFGHVRRVPLPAGTTTVWKVYTSARAGRLDIVALISRNNNDNKAVYWATQVLPPR
jgi:hypothetical protein